MEESIGCPTARSDTQAPRTKRRTGDSASGIRLLTALILVGGCTDLARRPPPPPSPAPSIEAAPAEGRKTFAPSPGAQFLVDPYPEREGRSWLGADVASSIRIDRDRYLWIFGDTLLGSVSDDCEQPRLYCDRKVEPGTMIHNSVGIAERGEDGSFGRIAKYWPEEGDFFPSGIPGEFFWPLSGANVDGVVLIAVNHHSAASGLAPVGNSLLRIANPTSEPDDWNVETLSLPNFRPLDGPPPGLVWTTALVHLDPYLYIFGLLGNGLGARTVLARIPASEAGSGSWAPRPEYLQRDSGGRLHWTREFAPDRLHPVRGLPGTSEATVQYSPGTGWFTYQIPPLEFEIRLFTSTNLEGPWRDRGAVYELPPPWPTGQRPDCTPIGPACRAYIAYAAKSHPELAPPGDRIVSYNVNLGSGQLPDAERAAEEVEGFYVPQMVIGPQRANATPDQIRSSSADAPPGAR
jgi:hypothetical protein